MVFFLFIRDCEEEIVRRVSEILERQLKIVLSEGTMVDEFVSPPFTYFLYSLGRDFYEIFFDNEKEEIVWVTHCDDDDLRKYLSRVDLPVV